MKILITLAESDPDAWLSATAEEQALVFEQHRAFDAAVTERGTLIEGAALSSVADGRIVRVLGGERVVTQGPYAETVEQLTGIYVVDLADVDVAIELVHLLPADYLIGIRPTIDLEGY